MSGNQGFFYPQGTQNPKYPWHKRFLNVRHILCPSVWVFFLGLLFRSLFRVSCLGPLFGLFSWVLFMPVIWLAWHIYKKVSDTYFSWFCHFSSSRFRGSTATASVTKKRANCDRETRWGCNQQTPPPQQTPTPKQKTTSWKQPPTQFFSTFSSAGQNVAKMAIKNFFQIFSNFSRTCQNNARMATKYFFQIFSKFPSVAKILSE